MKEILDRHAVRLTPEERRATWEKISGTQVQESRAGLRWPLPAMAALTVMAISLLLFIEPQRERLVLPTLETERDHASSRLPVGGNDASPPAAVKPAAPERNQAAPRQIGRAHV